MAQVITLTSPIIAPPPPATVAYSLVRLLLERVPVARVVVLVSDNNGNLLEVQYRDDSGSTLGTQLISALNTANLSTKSLQQRVLEKLVSDGKLPPGSVTGIPD